MSAGHTKKESSRAVVFLKKLYFKNNKIFLANKKQIIHKVVNTFYNFYYKKC